jgi:hypothetical protein
VPYASDGREMGSSCAAVECSVVDLGVVFWLVPLWIVFFFLGGVAICG